MSSANAVSDIVVHCPIHESFRVQQVAGMFDLELQHQATERFQVELPGAEEAWDIGLIVGPSGSGKSTVASRAFATELYQQSDWPDDRAVVDALGDLSVRDVTHLFTAVGFGSPPSWVKPYRVLSKGEQFRCDLARALSRGLEKSRSTLHDAADGGHRNSSDAQRTLVVFDEFTSVVDRNVAQVCAAAISKGIRRGHIPCRFVAVTCHYDVARWLEPDWTLDMASSRLERRRLRRPKIRLEISRCQLDAWRLFKRHHYLSSELAPSARCFLTTWQGNPVNFCATLPLITRRNHRRFTRIVTLPDYQGIGIGMRAAAAVASLHRAEGLRINVTSSHPALIRHCQRSARWRTVGIRRAGSRQANQRRLAGYQNAAHRTVVSFEYVGD